MKCSVGDLDQSLLKPKIQSQSQLRRSTKFVPEVSPFASNENESTKSESSPTGKSNISPVNQDDADNDDCIVIGEESSESCEENQVSTAESPSEEGKSSFPSNDGKFSCTAIRPVIYYAFFLALTSSSRNTP